MQTDELGYFELFDPVFHLTGIERSQLSREGLNISASQLSTLLDFTLVFKNSRVCVEDELCYHVASCSSLPKLPNYQIFTSISAVAEHKLVCKSCLQTLQYKGYDELKARKEAYSRQVFERFSLQAFWHEHTLYPVSERRDMRKELGN